MYRDSPTGSTPVDNVGVFYPKVKGGFFYMFLEGIPPHHPTDLIICM